MSKILIVEDDRGIAKTLEEGLEKNGYQAKSLNETERANVLQAVEKYSPNMILMDVQLDYRDGYLWCCEIRRSSNVPIIFLTARSSDIDLINAMRIGGDDFISKPFNMDVLLAKMESVLRRASGHLNENKLPQSIQVKDVTLHIDQQKVSYQNTDLDLTRNEFLILQALMRSEGKILSRNQLIKALWKDEAYINENALSVSMSRVRSKLSQIGVEDLIQTKIGKGYGVL